MFSRRMASEFFHQSTLFRTEGAGKAGRRLAPMVRVQQKSTRQNHRFSRIRPAFPAQWCYGLYVLSPVTRLCCHRRFASSTKLSASPGAPGPHDFAVRDVLIRLVRHRVHRIPLPTSVTIAKRPSCGGGTRGRMVLICPTAQGKMCTTGNLRMGICAALSTSLRATGSRECAPDDRLREAIQKSFRGNSLDCFVALRLAMTTCLYPRVIIPGSALSGCGMTESLSHRRISTTPPMRRATPSRRGRSMGRCARPSQPK